ncbi:MAG: ATP-binding cassette domain-containing protein [Anaerolineaceae bacterium]|nr:ATP-binding cassette domain-containing protein [Anaerolineaceae bacterium]
MSKTVISVEHLSKRYELGIIGATSMQRDLNRWWARVRGRPDPYLLVGQEDLSARAGEYIWALDDINFQVQQGEALGIIGANGAGKSTLLKILSQVTAPTKGKVKIKGRIGSLLEVGTGFHPELTGRENVYLNGAILGMTRAEVERKFDEIVGFSGVEKYIDTPVKRYSSGMKVRLAFAVAAHLETDILIVDEVLAVGDAEFQKKCLGKMNNVASEGRTVLFVSHNMLAIRSLCERIIWLEKGVIHESGTVDDMIEGYLKQYATMTTNQSWENSKSAPGNNEVRLHRIWVNSLDEKNDRSLISYDSPVEIGVEYWNLLGSELHVNLQVKVDQNIIAFVSGSPLAKDWKVNASTRGLIRSTCRIPAHFLKYGLHQVNVNIAKSGSKKILRLKDALTFNVVEKQSRKDTWFKKRGGVVYPKLPWRIEVINETLE